MQGGVEQMFLQLLFRAADVVTQVAVEPNQMSVDHPNMLVGQGPAVKSLVTHQTGMVCCQAVYPETFILLRCPDFLS